MNNYNDSLRERYNPDGSSLRRLQLRMLDILIEIDRICRRHQIRYWLSSGTLLGAVRHRGFIPWDDDLDIEVLREDYQNLLEVLHRELPKHLVVQTYDTDKNYAYLYAKIRDKNSYVKEKYLINQQFLYQGAFVDIFPVEPSPLFLCRFSRVLYNRLCLNSCLRKGSVNRSLFKMFRVLLSKIVFPFFRFIAYFYPRNVMHYSYGINFIDSINRKDIFPLQEIEFEGYSFFCPNNPDSYLRTLYGSYMQIPKEKEVHIENNEIEIW